MNRLPIEYTLAKSIARRRSDTFPPDAAHVTISSDKRHHDEDDDGVILLSEFVSTARVMRGALLINPWKAQEVGNPGVIVRYYWTKRILSSMSIYWLAVCGGAVVR